MLDSKTLGDIKIARNEYEAALKSRMGREAKKTALANILINNVVNIIETALEAEDLLQMLTEERVKSAELEKKIAELTSESSTSKKQKNG